MALAGFSLLLIMIIAGFFLWSVTRTSTALIADTTQASLETRQVEAMAHELAIISTNVHEFIAGNDGNSREACLASLAAIHRMLDNMLAQDADPGDRSFPALLHGSFGSAEASLNKLFSLKDPVGRDRESARRLLLETVRLIAFMNADIGTFRKGRIDASIGRIADHARALQTIVNLSVVMTLLIATVLLLGFAHFIRRTISVPLNDLQEGAREFSKGNLDFRLRVQGTDEISLIAGQMNDMADELTLSLRTLEDKLSESSNALAAVGRMEITIRHEINNPLTTIIGNLELLIEQYERKDRDLAARLELIMNNALRVAEIARRLHDIKKKEQHVDRRTGVKTAD